MSNFIKGVYEKPRDSRNNGIYNQDLYDKSLVIEIGGVDNTLEELNRSVDALAEVISEYYWEQAVEASTMK
ncbi:stage II sporulation protein P [Bacillus sp. N9]